MKKAIIDIDGVLNTYPKTQIDYFNFMLDKDYKSLDEIKNDLSYNYDEDYTLNNDLGFSRRRRLK